MSRLEDMAAEYAHSLFASDPKTDFKAGYQAAAKDAQILYRALDEADRVIEAAWGDSKHGQEKDLMMLRSCKTENRKVLSAWQELQK